MQMPLEDLPLAQELVLLMLTMDLPQELESVLQTLLEDLPPAQVLVLLMQTMALPLELE